MKAQKTSLGILGLFVFVFLSLISCSKKEDNNPTSPINEKVTLKDAQDVIDSRNDYVLLTEYPSFPGGDSLFYEYVDSNLPYPEDARNNHISGKVFTSFIIETDGTLSNIEILRGVDGLNDAVTDLFSNMPVWNPGKINGTPVRVKLVYPIEFNLH